MSSEESYHTGSESENTENIVKTEQYDFYKVNVPTNIEKMHQMNPNKPPLPQKLKTEQSRLPISNSNNFGYKTLSYNL